MISLAIFLWIDLRQHRIIASADSHGSFAPILQFEKSEIHTVFLDFPNFILKQNLSRLSLAELCGAALNKSGTGMPLRYNNDKRKKPLFSRGSRVCRHLFNSFSKLKSDEKNIKKRRLFH